MNKKHNRLIATARQYALVTFLGLGMSFAVVKAAVSNQKVAGITDQEWLYDEVGSPTSPASYSLNTGIPLAAQCEGDSEVCGIKAPENNGQPLIEDDGALFHRILQGNSTKGDVFMKD